MRSSRSLDLDELFRLQWGGRGSGPAYDRTVREEFLPTLRAAQRRGRHVMAGSRHKRSTARSPCSRRATTLVVYDPAAYESDGGALREIARFHFPRQVGRERLCIADYFRSAESGEVDVIALQVVTVGDAAAARFECLQLAGEYTEAYYVHGLAVEAAEAVAEWMHRRIRREWGLAPIAGEAILVGLRRLPRSRRPRDGVPSAARRGCPRHVAHLRRPTDAGAVDRRAHRAPSGRQVLRGPR